MAFSRLFANESLLGVDIGSSSIKIALAETGKHGVRISDVAVCPTPPQSVKEGVVVNVPEVAAAVQFAVRSAGIKASAAVAAIVGPGVTVRQVQLPVMPEQVLRRSIYFEAGKYISSSVEDSIIEFDILGKSQEEGQMDVVLVAAPRAMIDSRARAMEQAGLDLLAVDAEVFAVLRSLLEYSHDRSLIEGTIALLDIGATHTEINLVSKGRLALTRTIPIAGVSITNAIKNAEQCSDDEAEQHKFSLDLTEAVDTPAHSTRNPTLQAAQSLVDELLREIRRSVNYYQSQLPDGSSDSPMEKIILTGGTSRLKGLAAYTKSRLNVDTLVGNPLSVCEASPGSDQPFAEDDAPLLAVALGLALRESPVANILPVAA